MAERLRFILDGDDRLSPVLNRAGDSSARLHRRLADDSQASSRAMRAFTRDANGQLRDLEGRFVSVAHASRLIQDSNGRWRDLNGRFIAGSTAAQRMATVTAGLPPVLRQADQAAASVNGRLRDSNGRFISAGRAAGVLGSAADEASSALDEGGGLGGKLKLVAGLAGASLLPALGAVVPMMLGAGLAAGTMKLGFAGVGDAMEAAGKGKKEYAAALKKLSPEARSFTKELVSLKKEFSGVGRDVQKAMLPGFTSAVKSASPLVKILGRNMTDLGGTFGGLARKAGGVFRDSGFQRDLQTNLTLGKRFVVDLATGVGRLGRSFLDFGAASKPTLTALSSGIGDLLGKALPGMFSGLKVGIGGSASMLNGLFDMLNRVLPAIGRFSGEVARSLGPLFGEAFRSAGLSLSGGLDILGQAAKALAPVFKDLGFGLKSIMQIMKIVGPVAQDTASAIVGSLLPSFSRINEARGPLQRLSDAIADNKIGIMEFARRGGEAVLTFVQGAVQALPQVIHGFRIMSTGIVGALGGILHGAASAFGWIPGLGDKLKTADRRFKDFSTAYITGLKRAEDKASGFAASVGPKLTAGKLKLNINNWQSQLEEAKRKLKSVPPSKRSALLAKIDDLQAKVRTAKGQLAGIKDRKPTIRAYDLASRTARNVVAQLNRVQSKTVTITVQKRMQAGLDAVSRLAGFAKGGRPKAGWAVVGEEGPELVKFRGSETVFSNPDSRAMAAGAHMDSPTGVGLAAGQGLTSGLLGSMGSIGGAARSAAGQIITAMKAELQIASPSKRTRALAKDVGKGLISGLTGSKDKIKATSKDLAKDIWSAFTGSKDNRLVAYVNKHTKTLTSLAGKRDSIAATIKRAKDFAETTRVGAKQSASLGGMFEGEEQVSASGINSKLQQRLAKMKTFTSYINTLKKRGLNKTMLREILTMGPEEGYAYASALAGASSKLFKDINSTQYKVNSQAETLGRAGADALYDSGKAAGQGFLKGLSSQQKAIEKQMLKIAKGMQKALRRALGIRSPSRVMHGDGRHTMAGYIGGIDASLPALRQSMGAVADTVSGMRPAIRRPAVATGAGGGMVVNVNIASAMDPVAVAREVQKVIVRYGRAQGTAITLQAG
ncbi:hypothetical protein ACNYS0_20915 [Streptomyces sp. BH034]|uniref:hypothetical protein n=1 Tax=Streptomyces sp. BH034 TaxID=3402626 RepID=UPI003BB7B76D